MIYKTFPPPPSLSGFVRTFWVLEGTVARDQPYYHRTMADNCPEIVFHYRGIFDELLPSGSIEKSYTAGFGGQTQSFNRYRVNQNFGIFGVYLYPYAIPQLFNIPAHIITNHTPDIISVLGSQGKELEEKIMTAADNRNRIKVLSAFLEERLIKNYSTPPQVFSCIQHILSTRGSMRIESLARQYFLSTRQLERSFKQYAGFSPKLFSRLSRFHAVINQYGQPHKSLTELAYECGYYDQAHFIHDFKEFSGYHPSRYFSGSSEATEWREG